MAELCLGQFPMVGSQSLCPGHHSASLPHSLSVYMCCGGRAHAKHCFQNGRVFLHAADAGSWSSAESGFVLDVGSGSSYGQWYDRIFPE